MIFEGLKKIKIQDASSNRVEFKGIVTDETLDLLSLKFGFKRKKDG